MEGEGETALSVFHTRRLLQVIELPLENSDDTNVILTFASRCADKKQFQAFYCADKTLLLRSLEEDLRPRFWRLPWTLALDRMQQASSSSQLSGFNLNLPSLDGPQSSSSSNAATASQQVVALEFSPEGDWLVVIVSWGQRMFLLVVPVASLVTRERTLALQMHLRDGAPGDLMSVAPSCMSTQMMSFLRAHGHNGAKYRSTVTGDEEDMSTLEFSQGMTLPTCATWWRSFNGQNYVLVGSSSDLISLVHVETNKESCRCELSGKVETIELIQTAVTTTMLVKTTKQGETLYFKVLLEKKLSDASVKTFPDHFLEDKEFRPQRIKRFGPDCTLHVVHDAQHVAVHQGAHVSFFSNDFSWTLSSECTLPVASTAMRNVHVQFCSSQLILLQATCDDNNIAAWISHRLKEPEVHESKIVHSLKLREDEWIRHVVPGNSLEVESDLLYFLHTDHQIYECRPKWSRLTLFQALHARSMHVQDAVFIGYAMGIDMASLCEVVADTICAEHQPHLKKKMSRNSCEWVMRLYAKSRVLPSKAMEKMVFHGGLLNAIEYARETLVKPDIAATDRQFLAHTLLECALNLYQTEPSAANWPWLLSFLETNPDFDTRFAIDRCVYSQCVDAALHIGHHRRDVDIALLALQKFGLRLSADQVKTILDRGHASTLTAPETRVLFRSLSLEHQIQTMLLHPSAFMLQRDWVVRVLPDVTDSDCLALAKALDPRLIPDRPLSSTSLPYYVPLSDVATSEAIAVTLEEKVELFLTVLLRLNSSRCYLKPPASEYTQDELLSLIKLWNKQYRPPVMVLRCAEYANWAAAATCYEAQGEWVDAIECKLHLHELQEHKDADHVITHEELVTLMETLVFSNTMAESMRVAVLARLFIHWFAMKYDIGALEKFLSQQSDLSLVAQILFTAPSSQAFDERDQEWILQCQKLPFSGPFYLHVCQSQVKPPHDEASKFTSLVDSVLENIARHHTDVPHVMIQRQTPTSLGQNDPIETHAKVFSCGHAFPKRVYEDDVVPLFEKKMATYAIPNTTLLLVEEYRKAAPTQKRIEAPCPVCAFSRIQSIFAQQNTRKMTREPPRPRIMTSDQWVWK
ncbi:Aste57867_8109 [Aphanomyces stellatus]|uniref:Aste57867_8109 protein n=1 Tax=Aphanomyces stellatus TaxID=120398 RepID=A0A485KJF3_9STRA|nr:hypothetical protein As57867_008079 [Aphanomyces stellatus]VFT84998.1 Aste57867_8109 [Aphanomyces stellatus]